MRLGRRLALLVGCAETLLWGVLSWHYWTLLPHYDHVTQWMWFKVIEGWALESTIVATLCGLYVGWVMLTDEHG